jgi:hypothetical protein
MLIGCPPSLAIECSFLGSVGAALMLSPVAWGLLTAPAYVAVSRVVENRFVPLLDRGPLERWVVLGASILGAFGAVLYALAIAAILDRTGNVVPVGRFLIVFIAPAPLGAIPWAAGELVGRESARPRLALACAILIAYAVSLSAFVLLESSSFGAGSPEVSALQAAATPIAAGGAGFAYRAVRGKALEPPSPEAVALERVASIIRAR